MIASLLYQVMGTQTVKQIIQFWAISIDNTWIPVLKREFQWGNDLLKIHFILKKKISIIEKRRMKIQKIHQFHFLLRIFIH
ncbi:hypothetical protein CVN76_03010 [Bacillus sp. mrc49]|nr:hypothetical protein CVN76_03010 [Bacillus sp. mrc49]